MYGMYISGKGNHIYSSANIYGWADGCIWNARPQEVEVRSGVLDGTETDVAQLPASCIKEISKTGHGYIKNWKACRPPLN